MVGFASFVCLASLVACEGSEAGEFDNFARSGVLAEPGVVGRFETRAMTMEDGTARVLHYLIEGNNEHEIVLSDGMEIERDAIVRAVGELNEDGALVVDGFTIVEHPPQALIDPDPYAPRRLATILVTWEGAGGITNGIAESDMYTGPKSTNVFYGENSYGKETMAGRVFGPYTIEQPANCNATAIANAALIEFADRGHRESDWSQIMYYFPGVGGCGWAGLASVGSVQNPARDSWYNGAFGCVVRNQEIGHNYGMGHSHAYSGCPEESVMGEGCEHVEYGDPYDPMGGGCGHINAVQKGFMGWLEGCNYVNGTASTRYNIAPLEVPCNGTQALRIPTSDGRWYYLEYRAPIGEFDNSLSGGVIVHAAGDINSFGPSPYILDLGIGGLMQEGDSFTDPQGTVSFTIEAISDTHAVVDVVYPEGANETDPTCIDGADPGMEDGAVGSLECASEPYPGDESPPTVELTYPADGDVFDPGSSFVITAEPDDDRGVMELELYINGEPQFKLYEPPWEWDVTAIPEGKYEFGIVARDSRHWTPSNAVSIDVGVEAPDESETAGSSSGDGPVVGTDDAGDTLPPEDDTGDSGDTGDGDTEGASAAADDSGCNCSSNSGSGGGAPGAAGLLLLAMGWMRRRRN